MHIQQNVSLKPYNTFHLDAKTAYFVEVSSVEDVQTLIKNTVFQDNKTCVLGGGSNILLTKDFDGLMIKNNILGKNIVSTDDQFITVAVGAGENRHEFVLRAVKNNYGGIENLALIPGSVGAAPMQNIGAYGVEAKDVIVEVHYVDLSTGTQKVLSADECQFGYRTSIFKTALKGKIIITHVVFHLYNSMENYTPNLSYQGIQNQLDEMSIGLQEVTIRDVADAVVNIRQCKLPDWTKIGTAGSFFKNPIVSVPQFHTLQQQFPDMQGFSVSTGIKLSAGQLIDMAGLKGIDRGTVGTYQNHALVLVHHGGGTGQDIVALANYIQSTVEEKFGVILEPEVNYI